MLGTPWAWRATVGMMLNGDNISVEARTAEGGAMNSIVLWGDDYATLSPEELRRHDAIVLQSDANVAVLVALERARACGVASPSFLGQAVLDMARLEAV